MTVSLKRCRRCNELFLDESLGCNQHLCERCQEKTAYVQRGAPMPNEERTHGPHRFVRDHASQYCAICEELGGHKNHADLTPEEITSHRWSIALPSIPILVSETRQIIQQPVYPPIPTNAFDWCAYYDGEEEAGNYGWGATKEAALADLEAQCQTK